MVLTVLAIGCGGVIGEMSTDSGTPATFDAGQIDAGQTAVVDAGQTAPLDAGLDAGQVIVDAGTSVPDAGNGLVPVFMAQGHLGRSIMSCDDGLTWVNDRSDNPEGRCWVSGPNEVECDHTPISGVGLDTGDGWFFANFGWGSNGTARRTRDGRTWEVIRDGAWGGGITYSDGVIVWLAGGNWPVSVDKGATWGGSGQAIPSGYFDSRTITRSGTKIAVSGDPVAGLFSRDSGRTWFLVDLTDSVVWGRNVVLAEGNGTLLTLSSVGGPNNTIVTYSARSSDDGKTWRGKVEYSGNDWNNGWNGLFFTGTEFVTFSNGKKLTSTDGSTWSSTTVSISGAAKGPIARGPTGTYVSIPNNWGGYYDKQSAYRSVDGVTWSKVNGFPGGHPITRVLSGFLPAAACR